VFYFKESITGTVFFDPDGNGVRESGESGIAGITVNLLDSTGAVIASTTTDANGKYSFTDQTGIPGTERFSLSINVPPGYTQNLTQIQHDPGTIFLTRGGLDFGNENLAVMAVSATQSQVATHFGFVKLSGSKVGAPVEVVLVALNAQNQVVTNYTGAVQFTSTDSQASFPANYTFTPDDGGQHHFFITFEATGDQTLTATDVNDNTLVGDLAICLLA
jgi:hypothetical protein